jgi:hypothetical protein
VAFGVATTTIDALVVHPSTMTVWTLNGGSDAWMQGQVRHVNIKFGSS